MDTKAVGECGKKLVKKLFRENGYMVTKPDSGPKDYIDFLAYKNSHLLKVFVRTDTRICVTDNIVIERFTHRENGPEIGWLFEGKADMLCYLDANNGNVYFFDWRLLKEYVMENCKATPFRNPFDDNAIGDAYIVSLRRLKKIGLCLGQGKVDVSPMYQFKFNRPAPF